MSETTQHSSLEEKLSLIRRQFDSLKSDLDLLERQIQQAENKIEKSPHCENNKFFVEDKDARVYTPEQLIQRILQHPSASGWIARLTQFTENELDRLSIWDRYLEGRPIRGIYRYPGSRTCISVTLLTPELGVAVSANRLYLKKYNNDGWGEWVYVTAAGPIENVVLKLTQRTMDYFFSGASCYVYK